MTSPRPPILLLGPDLNAVSGVSTHLRQLFGSELSSCYRLSQFQVGSEGRAESRASMLLRALTSPVALAGCIIWRSPAIVHINTSFEPKGYWRDLAYLAVTKAFRRKVIYQVHGGAPPAEMFPRSRLLTSLLKRVLLAPDVVVLLAQSELAAYRDFVPQARLILIANAIELPAADLGAERYAPGRPLELAYLGRLAENKGILESVAAVGVLRDRGIEARLSIAGSGPAQHKLLRAIETAQLGDRVRFLGPVFGAAKQELWQKANVFAFPTFHHEGLPYALLESMAAGAVPVVSPVGAIPDVVQDQVHGMFVPPRNPAAIADAFERLHHDRDSLRRMALAGRQRILEHYSVSRLAGDFRRLYASLAAA
jgi:glycosyltransferase involved in cell wall biosynthesis